jgi:hypothetical protein
MSWFQHRVHGWKGGLARLMLLPVLTLAVFGLTQCRSGVGDLVTGVDARDAGALHGGGRSSRCQLRCDARYRACRRSEEARHRAALKACDRLSREERRACVRQERIVHARARAECVAEKTRCRRDCRYREGSGTGGR